MSPGVAPAGQRRPGQRRPSPWDDVQPETSRRLLLAAVEAFAERGYHATTTRDVATRAGLSPAGLYVHYASKSALLAHISTVGHQAALRLVEQALAREDEPGRRVGAMVEDFVAWHSEHHAVARVVQYELGSLPEPARRVVVDLRRRTERLLESEIRRGVRAGTFTADQPRAVARAILSMGIDVARWYDPAGRESPQQLGELYAGLALRMLGNT